METNGNQNKTIGNHRWKTIAKLESNEPWKTTLQRLVNKNHRCPPDRPYDRTAHLLLNRATSARIQMAKGMAGGNKRCTTCKRHSQLNGWRDERWGHTGVSHTWALRSVGSLGCLERFISCHMNTSQVSNSHHVIPTHHLKSINIFRSVVEVVPLAGLGKRHDHVVFQNNRVSMIEHSNPPET